MRISNLFSNKYKNIFQDQQPRERSASISQNTEKSKSAEVVEIENKISERENFLLPMYHQVSVHFADLHDTPERMLEKGCIQVINFIINIPIV